MLQYVLRMVGGHESYVCQLSNHHYNFSFLFLHALHVRSIVEALGSVVSGENSRDRNCRGQIGSERGTLTLRTSTSVAILSKQDVGSVLLTSVPDRPTLGVDDRGHVSLLEDNTGILAPRSTKVVSTVGDGVAGSCGNVAVVEDVVRHVGVRVTAVGCLELVIVLDTWG